MKPRAAGAASCWSGFCLKLTAESDLELGLGKRNIVQLQGYCKAVYGSRV